MEIKVGIGIDDIYFGMSQKDVVAKLGKPDKINSNLMKNAVTYFYNDKMALFYFDEEDDLKLTSIEVYHPEALMFNQPVINKSKSEIVDWLNTLEYTKLEYEEYDYFDTIFCEDIWAEFEFQFEKVVCVKFGPLFDEDDETIWPLVH